MGIWYIIGEKLSCSFYFFLGEHLDHDHDEAGDEVDVKDSVADITGRVL